MLWYKNKVWLIRLSVWHFRNDSKKSLQYIWQIPYPGKTAFPAPLITFSSLPQDSWQKQFHGEKVYFGSGMYLSWQRAWSMAGEVCIGAHYMVPRNSVLRLQTALPRLPPDTQPWNMTATSPASKTLQTQKQLQELGIEHPNPWACGGPFIFRP